MSKYIAKLRSVGNPDFGQYAPLSNPQTVEAESLPELSRRVRDYITFWDLGGGNWPKIYVSRDGKRIGTISYNGRVWDSKGKELCES